MSLEEVDVPEIGHGEALVRVYAVGVCGTDFELILGSDLLPYIGYPTIPGHEITGHIARVYDEGTGFKEGLSMLAAVALTHVHLLPILFP